MLDQFGCITGFDTFLDHAVVAKNGAGLQYATKNGLLTHQVGFYFRNKRRLQNTCTMTTGSSRVCLGQFQAFALWIVLRVNRDQGRYTKATLVLFADF